MKVEFGMNESRMNHQPTTTLCRLNYFGVLHVLYIIVWPPYDSSVSVHTLRIRKHSSGLVTNASDRRKLTAKAPYKVYVLLHHSSSFEISSSRIESKAARHNDARQHHASHRSFSTLRASISHKKIQEDY